jgi:hypothetical protein
MLGGVHMRLAKRAKQAAITRSVFMVVLFLEKIEHAETAC